MKTRTVLIIFILALIFCRNPFSPSKGAPTSSGSDSPQTLLEDLKLAYNLRDIDLFKELLSDDFKFVFNLDTSITDLKRFVAEDIDNDGQLEYYWGKDREIRSHENMFNQTKSIELSFIVPDSSQWTIWLDPETGDTNGVYIEVSNIILDLTTNSDYHYRVDQARQKFGFIDESVDTTPKWTIGEWHDEG